MPNENNDANPIACSLEEVENHLRSFISNFIIPQAQPRWLEFLIDKRFEWEGTPRTPRRIKFYHKADEVMRHCAVEPQFCVKIPNSQCTPYNFDSTFGKVLGVYFALDMPPCRMNASDALARFMLEDRCALLSFLPGKKALFFCHDGGIWKCGRE